MTQAPGAGPATGWPAPDDEVPGPGDLPGGSHEHGRPVPLARRRSAAALAELTELDGRPVGLFRLGGGEHRGAIGPAEGETVARVVSTAAELGVPVIGLLATSGADVSHGIASLQAWGRVARALTAASGVVPVAMVVSGPCLAGPALLLGLADVVVVTRDSYAYVSGPAVVHGFTGQDVTHDALGGPSVHAVRTGVAWAEAGDEDDALGAVLDYLAYLPPNNSEEPPARWVTDPVDRETTAAAAVVPERPTASYDVRAVVEDVVDEHSFLEVRRLHAPSMVTGLATIAGLPVGVVANQPSVMAGTIDIDASRKAARFVQLCDAFNVPLVTFVDTPGFQPGKEVEWRGMIRHGAELVHAYAAATVPRVSVVLRKAYGGAYIVMDSRGLGGDVSLAWPGAEVAVMGPAGAVSVLHGRRLAALDSEAERERERAALEADYAANYCSSLVAAERGFVDDVVEPGDTRRAVGAALAALRTKRERLPRRRHANTPL
ncbi:MAG TPA: carboxyl transferase domain-containing protein [Acidimicrobiales bacterium]|nr:carboxyl transferase domain-containing protein [Acidimicrobiales bacterium]